MYRSKLLRSRLALYGGIASLIVVIVSLIGPLLVPYGSSEFSADILSPASKKHFLGTDEHGRDLFSRIICGGRVTLSLAVTIVFCAGVVGTLWGLMAAYVGGSFGLLINRLIDVIMSFPSILIALMV